MAERGDDGFFEKLHGIRVRRLQGLFGQHWQRWFRARGLQVTPVQGGLLLMIRDNPGSSQIALSRAMRIEPPTLLETLAPLVRRGLVRRTRSAADGRVFELRLTDRGLAAASVIDRETPAHEADLLRRLDPAERRLLLDLLDRAIAGAEEAIGALAADDPEPPAAATGPDVRAAEGGGE